MPDQKKNALPMIIVLCVIAAAAVLGVFIYQQNASTQGITQVEPSPEPGITPADGSNQAQ